MNCNHKLLHLWVTLSAASMPILMPNIYACATPSSDIISTIKRNRQILIGHCPMSGRYHKRWKGEGGGDEGGEGGMKGEREGMKGEGEDEGRGRG